ncbi:DUF3572 family protein [Sphingomicrobium lutaoense]|uniref:DUF3572 domain-containing protein n=1 Tax=Sphingomicrobium lutaoense TaxID=515949 RepID=A0A839YXF6_9SPHN|nr:DUF3572 family protein [Sphingomicrobium lutaoense]MBB3764871.1 hypothetical protein [Sphingomicrobium lutaoense]
MTRDSTNDPPVLALRALAATLADERRAERLLALTGLDAEGLRAHLGEPALLAQMLAFLESHEPDLLAVAADLDVDPAQLVAARQALEA